MLMLLMMMVMMSQMHNMLLEGALFTFRIQRDKQLDAFSL